MSNECHAIQSATAEKFGGIIQALTMSLAGFIIAFWIGWAFALVCLGMFPFLLVGIITMGVLMKQGIAD